MALVLIYVTHNCNQHTSAEKVALELALECGLVVENFMVVGSKGTYCGYT